ncbi:MAG: hypothetical protein RL693_81 [Verrucomicrobiota bacterium]
MKNRNLKTVAVLMVMMTSSAAMADTIIIGNQNGVSAVGDRGDTTARTDDDYMTQLNTGQHVDQATDVARFNNASICRVSGGNAWSLRRDGTLDPRRPAPVCTPIVNGQVRFNLGRQDDDGSTYIIRYENGGFDWVGQDRIQVVRN